jgi:hypothetical protein
MESMQQVEIVPDKHYSFMAVVLEIKFFLQVFIPFSADRQLISGM